MKQFEAVIATLERLGGQATLAQLYQEVMKVPGVKWGTKTPFASIRRIVQVRPEIFKVRPGLWALESHRPELGLFASALDPRHAQLDEERSHSYYQGLLAIIGNLRGYPTYIPNQDRNKLCLKRPLAELRSLQEVPSFSYEELTRKASTVDVTWFSQGLMPHSLFEVEHSTDIQNSLLKFNELQDFNVRMFIVAAPSRKKEFEQKARYRAFREISGRVTFYDYETLARDYEHETMRANAGFSL